MRFVLPFGFLLAVSFLSIFQSEAVAAETCSCTATYDKWHSGLHWSDFLCVFPSTSSGPYTERRRVTWTHDYANTLYVSKSWIYSGWDNILLIKVGAEKAACESPGGMQDIAKKILIAQCKSDGGSNCDSISMSCTYRNAQ